MNATAQEFLRKLAALPPKERMEAILEVEAVQLRLYIEAREQAAAEQKRNGS